MAYCDLRVKIRNLSERWHSKEPKEKFRYLYGIPKWMFEVVGVRVYGDCHVNLFSHFGNILVVYYVSMVSYTIYYWYCKGQVLYGLRCLCGMGIMVSSLPLYYKSIGVDRFKFNSLLNFAGGHMYGHDKHDASKFSMVCEAGMKKMLNSYAIMTCIMCTSMSLIMLGPMHLFVTTGMWITPFGIQFPYADESAIAFWLDLAIQMGVGLLGIMITVSIEMSQLIVNNAVEMGADIITLNVNEMAEQLYSDGKMNYNARIVFRNIVLQFHDFDLFISNFANVFYWRTLLGPFSLSLATAFCAYAQKILRFPAGYGAAASSYIELIILCYMGQNVKNANNQMYGALSNIPWYLLSPKKQKDLSHLLLQMQCGLRLTIGPFGELNYEMGSDLTKRIYRFLMVLIRLTK